jgi:eukaryotic-like serine/threonine-protein kinase
MSLKNFLLSKLFLKHLGLAVLIIVGITMITLIWLNLYTRHGQARPVPDFYGLTMDQVSKVAKKNRLRYQVIDSVYTNVVPRGCVAEQSPKPGFRVKKWRNIVLTINAYNPEMVAMPNLVDLPIRQAIASIVGSGLQMGELRYRPDLSIDVVIEQLYNGRNILEGDSLQKGSVIDLVLGKGLSNQRTAVPDLIGLSLDPARNRLLNSSLNLGTFIYDNTILNQRDSLKAFVYKQNPEYRDDATLQLGSAVYLWLTVDSAKLPVNTPGDTAAADSIPEPFQPDDTTN